MGYSKNNFFFFCIETSHRGHLLRYEQGIILMRCRIYPKYSDALTLILLFTTTPTFENSVDPDQMASEEAI